MTDFYKVSVMPFTKGEAKQICHYLAAFTKDKTVEIEKINDPE